MTDKDKFLIGKEKFPKYREVLINLAEADQREIRENFHAINEIKSEIVKSRKYTEIARHCHSRAHKMLEILREIERPTIENIGEDGCEAAALLALHSYLDIMKQLLDLLESQFKLNPSGICYKSIPALKDRILILEHKNQLFGTNWMLSKDGKPFLIPVDDFAYVNQRRALYGLDPIRRPVNLAIGAKKYPLGKGLAKASDQKKLNDEEYGRYSRYYLRSEL